MSKRKSVLAYMLITIRSANTYLATIAWLALLWVCLYVFFFLPPLKVWVLIAFFVFLLEVSARTYALGKGKIDIEKDNFIVMFVVLFDACVAAVVALF